MLVSLFLLASAYEGEWPVLYLVVFRGGVDDKCKCIQSFQNVTVMVIMTKIDDGRAEDNVIVTMIILVTLVMKMTMVCVHYSVFFCAKLTAFVQKCRHLFCFTFPLTV